MGRSTENSTNISRRKFIEGGLLTGAAIALGTAVGCGSNSSTEAADESDTSASTAATSTTEDWLGAAPDIADSDIANTYTADVIVVGGGFAGHCAANSALDHGASSVIVLEKGEAYRAGGAIMGTINSRLHKELGDEYDEQHMYNEYMKSYMMMPDAHLVRMWAYQSGAATDWLLDKCDAAGVDYTIYTTYPEGFDFDNEISATYKTGIAIDKSKHDNMESALKVLDNAMIANGGEIRYSTSGVKLVQDTSGRVTGVIAKTADGTYELYNATRGVMLCTGDYGGNKTMCDTFLIPEVANLAETFNFYNGNAENAVNTGDGQKMACWAGAKMEDGPHPSMAWARSDAFSNMPFLQVNTCGERFMNEAMTIMFWPRNIYRQPDHTAYQIVDANFVDHAAQMSPATPDGLMTTLPDSKVKICQDSKGWFVGDTIEELAKNMGVPEDNLKATIERYNSMAGGTDEDYGKLGKYIIPLDTPPFKAHEVTCGFAVSLGGVYVNKRLQVKDADGNGIPGLYAAGNTVGRRFGLYYEDAITGTTNAHALTHGYYGAQYLLEDNA